MKKQVKFGLISLLYIIGLLTAFVTPAFAEDSTTDSGAALTGFSYEVILPENQHNPNVGYYDLRMTPGKKQTIQMKMNNTSDKEVTILVDLNGAKTNSNGVIEYGKSEIKDDASLKYKFTDIVKAPTEMKLPPNSVEMLDIEITMPDSSFEGYISGAVTLEEKDANNPDSKTSQGMIKNRFVYQTGIQLSEADSDNLKPDLKLNKVYPELNNYRNAIFVNFSNITPVYINDMTVDVQITKKGSEEVLYDTKKSKMRMAPNTLIDFPVTMNGEKMNPGNYRAKVLVTTLAGGRWQWDQEFKITDEEADKFNEQDLTLVQSSGINWKLIALIIGIALLLILIIFMIVRTINKKKKANKKGQKSKKKKAKK